MASKKSKESKKQPDATTASDEIVIDFDSNWKYLIEKYYFQFIAFFLPKLFDDIDVNRLPVFLDNELQTIWRSMKTGLKMTDKLMKVWLKNGEEHWVLVHIEVQARFETLFSKRMFTMSYRILDKYQVAPVALAVFVDTLIPSSFDTYEHTIYGTKTMYQYNTYKIIEQIETELLKSDNLFALVVLANLRTIQTKKKGSEFDRLMFKKHLYNLLIERNFEPEVYHDLLNFIDYMMILPEELKIEYDDFLIEKTKKEPNMLKMKAGPSAKNFANTACISAYGVDIDTIKRDAQVAKRKARLATNRLKEADNKAKDEAIKAKEAAAKTKEVITILVLTLRFDRTAEQIAAMAKISVGEVKAILEANPVS